MAYLLRSIADYDKGIHESLTLEQQRQILSLPESMSEVVKNYLNNQ